MNRQDLFESIGSFDEELLERSEKNQRRKKKKRHILRWMTAVAAILVVAVGVSFFAKPEMDPTLLEVYAIEQAEYPEMVQKPKEEDFEESEDGNEEYWEARGKWWDSLRENRLKNTQIENLEDFFAESIQEFMSDSQGENIVYSPVNVYMALGMLAEVSDGSSRQQILDLLNTESIEAIRQQAKEVWNAHYKDDGAGKSILASSLWLNEDISFIPSTMQSLAETYYASSYQGEMGSAEFNRAMQTWLNDQTGGLLEDQIRNIKLTKETVLALATTINYQAEWHEVFLKEDTKEGIFHAFLGNVTCDFMHDTTVGHYYWGEKFGAVDRYLSDSGGNMFFILPDEGVSMDELLADPELTEFIFSDYESRNKKSAILNLSIPKFDISSQINLKYGLTALGVTDIFQGDVADFSAVTTDESVDSIYVSKMPHGVRVAIDEKGVTAAAYTVAELYGVGIPDDEIDFVLDRPFLFVLNSESGLPLFVGIVNRPG